MIDLMPHEMDVFIETELKSSRERCDAWYTNTTNRLKPSLLRQIKDGVRSATEDLERYRVIYVKQRQSSVKDAYRDQESGTLSPESTTFLERVIDFHKTELNKELEFLESSWKRKIMALLNV